MNVRVGAIVTECWGSCHRVLTLLSQSAHKQQQAVRSHSSSGQTNVPSAPPLQPTPGSHRSRIGPLGCWLQLSSHCPIDGVDSRTCACAAPWHYMMCVLCLSSKVVAYSMRVYICHQGMMCFGLHSLKIFMYSLSYTILLRTTPSSIKD